MVVLYLSHMQQRSEILFACILQAVAAIFGAISQRLVGPRARCTEAVPTNRRQSLLLARPSLCPGGCLLHQTLKVLEALPWFTIQPALASLVRHLQLPPGSADLRAFGQVTSAAERHAFGQVTNATDQRAFGVGF